MSAKPPEEASTRAPYRTLLSWQLLILVAVSFQYVVAWYLTPEDMVFTGAIQNPDDLGVYVAAMRQGADGEWLFHFTYSPEAWRPRLMLLPYLALGKVTALVAQPDALWLHLWRVALGSMSLWFVWLWVRTVLQSSPRGQRTAWFLIWFGSGLGWLLALVRPSSIDWLPDIGLPEWSPIASIFNTPHFALGVGLEALSFACLLKVLNTEDKTRWKWSLVASITAMLTALTYVYHLATIIAAIGVFLVGVAAQERRMPWQESKVAAIIVVPLLPLLGYYLLHTGDDPYWIHYTRFEHVVPPPSLVGTLIGLGGLAPLAIVGGRRWLKEGRTWLLPAWAIASLLLLYLPLVKFSGRFALGLLVPVATLAAVGLECVLLPFIVRSYWWRSKARLRGISQATIRRAVLIMLMPSVLMSLLLLGKGPLVQRGFPYYLPAADVAAARWLGHHSGESAITLAYYPIGNYLPRVYGGKVFVGHLHYTSGLQTKLDLFEQFWADTTSATERAAFVEQWSITHVFVGSYERTFIGDGPRPPGEAVYDREGVTIYDVSEIIGRPAD